MRPIPPGTPPWAHLLLTIGDVVFYAGLPAMVLFAILYATRSRWMATREGKALLFLSSSMTLVGLSVAARLTFGEGYPGQPFVRLVAYLAFSSSAWWLFITLIRAQRRDDVTEHAPQGEETKSG